MNAMLTRLDLAATRQRQFVSDASHELRSPVAAIRTALERFSRLDDSRARDKGGSGLGLAVVRSIVTRHHGRVWATDSPFGGARLIDELPTLVSATTD